MNESRPDPDRLEEGLRRLRELGYLQGPAVQYAARRVPAGASTLRVAGATGFWVGAVGGAAFAVLLTISALIADSTLLDRPGDLGWLGLDLVLLMSGVGLISTLIFTAAVLSWWRRRGSGTAPLLEPLLLLVPGLVASLYLTDRLARHALTQLPGTSWWIGAVVVVLVAGVLAALATLALTAMMATARLQWKGVWKPKPLRPAQRWLPWVGAMGGSALLLLLGPYADLRPLPYLDDLRLEVDDVRLADRGPLVIVAVDGVDGLPWLAGAAPAAVIDSGDAPPHPAAFWNEISTGFSAMEHGLADAAASGPRGLARGLGTLRDDPILDLVLRHVLPGVGLGTLRAADQRELRRPPFWEILAHAGVRSRVINWWATYPAALHENLEIVSDRALLRLVAGEGLQLDAVAPELLLEGTMASESAAWEGEDLLAAGLDTLEAHGVDEVVLRDAWRLAVLGDRVHLELLDRQTRGGLPPLRVVLLNGADILARATLRSSNGSEAASSRALVKLHREWLVERLRELDRAEDSIWWLSSSSVAGPGPRRFAWIGGEETGRAAASVLRLAPSVLSRFGLEPARDMAGGSGVGTFGRRPRWTPEADRSSEDLDRLRSLGYIGG